MASVENIGGRPLADRIPASPNVRLGRARLRARLLKVFVAGLCAALLFLGIYEWLAAPSLVSTDDAYVNAVFAQVTPQIDGTIGAVAVHDTQYVRKGDLLVTIDAKDAELDYQSAKAAYQASIRRVQEEMAETSAAEANVLAKRALAAQAEQQWRRRVDIKQPGVVAGEEISNARSALDGARYALSIAEQQLAAKRAISGDATIELNPDILTAKTNVERAKLRLERTVIRAPIDGIVADSRVQVGQQISAGTELMAIVPTGQLFVDANFKEGQVTNIRIGQLATLRSDIYGSGRVFRGYVEGVGGGTGAAFAVIPPQNATGNWIKVVQRVPVRIALDPAQLRDTPLRAGVSMSVDIHLDQYVGNVLERTRRPAMPQVALRTNSSASF